MTAHDENIFGKMRGRFDDRHAQQAMRDAPERALAACACMDERRFAIFVEKFNGVFATEHRPGWKIVATGVSKTTATVQRNRDVARAPGYIGDRGNLTIVRNGSCPKCETRGATRGCS